MLHRTTRALESGVEAGHHLGAQVSARIGGAHHQLAIGEREVGVPMTNTTRLAWFSACKPILALAICAEWERERLDIHAPVCDMLPEFVGRGLDPERQTRKRQVTPWHLLTHTAGLRLVPGVGAGGDWQTQLEAIYAAPPEPGWEPGQKGGYHERTSWTLLAELYRVVSGVARADGIGRQLHEAIIAPVGAGAATYGLAAQAANNEDAAVSPPLVMEEASAPRPHPIWRVRHAFDPAAGVYGPASALSAMYQSLLEGDHRVVSTSMLDQMTVRQRQGLMDHTFRRDIDWGLGFAINSQKTGELPIPYGYGSYASMQTFGHGGMQTTIGFADPAVGLAAAVICNGLPGEVTHRNRAHRACDALYQDLGLP